MGLNDKAQQRINAVSAEIYPIDQWSRKRKKLNLNTISEGREMRA